MIDTAIISYSGAVNNSNNENKVTNTTNTANITNTTNTSNNVVTSNNTASNKIASASINKVTNETTKDIPEAGASTLPIFILTIGIIILAIRFKKYYDLSEDMKLK